jgi:hypothetical protein
VLKNSLLSFFLSSRRSSTTREEKAQQIVNTLATCEKLLRSLSKSLKEGRFLLLLATDGAPILVF